jgi:hypothetical protein
MNPNYEERRREAELMKAAGMRLPWQGYPEPPKGTLDVWGGTCLFGREPKPRRHTEAELDELRRQHGLI